VEEEKEVEEEGYIADDMLGEDLVKFQLI